MREIAIIGAGSWGTALALVAARAGHRVRLWAHSAEVAAMLRLERENKIYLPGFTLPDSVAPTDDVAEAAEKEIGLLDAHLSVFRPTCRKMLERSCIVKWGFRRDWSQRTRPPHGSASAARAAKRRRHAAVGGATLSDRT